MAVTKRGSRFGVTVYRDGRREWIGTFDTPEEADFAEAEAKLKGPGRSELARDFADRWLEDYSQGGRRWSPSTSRNIAYCLRAFVAEFGELELGDIPTIRARRWAQSQPASTIRAVRAMMNDALEDELVDRNPFANLGLAQSRGRKDIISLTEEELYLLADIARTHGPWLEAFVLFQGFQGLRPWVCTAEIRPEHIAGDELRLVHPGKRVPPRTVLLLPEAAAAIDRLEPEAGGYLFTTPRGNRIAQANVGTYWWNKIRYVFESKLDPRRAAELRDARPDLGAIDPYELRHTAITLMLRRGLTPEQVAWQVGHTDEGYEVRTRYGHPTDADRMDAVRKELAHA